MRVCYFVQSHRAPAQVGRLVDTLRRLSPGALIVVGHDARGCELDLGASRSEVRVLRSTAAVERGALSALSPYLDACRWLLAERKPFDWLVYLSGQDYPLQPLEEIERELATTAFDGFLDGHDAGAESTPPALRRRAQRRYGYRYRPPSQRARLPLRLLRSLNSFQSRWHVYSTYGLQLGVRRATTPFDDRFHCFLGTAWSTLTRPCVEYLVETLDRRPELLDFYRESIVADESLVQTVLCNEDRFRIAADDRRYVAFEGAKDGRPRTLTVADLPALFASSDHFARKFDADVDSVVLDRLDERLGVAGVPAGG